MNGKYFGPTGEIHSLINYCRIAKEIRETEWKHCSFLADGDVCQFSGSCDKQISYKSFKYLQERSEVT